MGLLLLGRLQGQVLGHLLLGQGCPCFFCHGLVPESTKGRGTSKLELLNKNVCTPLETRRGRERER